MLPENKPSKDHYVPEFYLKYVGEDADAADVLMAHASKIKDLDLVYIFIFQLYFVLLHKIRAYLSYN